MGELLHGTMNWAIVLGAAAIGGAAGYFSWKAVYAALSRWALSTKTWVDDLLLPELNGPGRFMTALAGASLVMGFAPGAPAPDAFMSQAMSLCWIGALSWLTVSMSAFLEKVLARRYSLGAENNLLARKVRTRYAVFHRSVIVAVSILALGAGLMTFDEARKLGASILASAGVIGAVAGFSAQKTLGAFFAGIQIALTQPIRVDDVIVAEGKWGRVEEITFTYVVVRLWDEKRLTLPISYFLETPFENWTRTDSRILGTVHLRADYTVDIEAVRARLAEICRERGRDLWDGRVCRLQATGAGERTVELRALVSSADASRNWDLRCLVREELLRHLREEQPGALPRLRARVEEETAAADPAA